jgi:membrane-associated phospholipid phosphatase
MYSPLIAGAITAATMLWATSCSEPTVNEGADALDARAEDRTRSAASVEWNEIERRLVIKHQANPFQALRGYTIVSLAQYNAVIAAELAENAPRPASRRAAAARASAVVLAYLYPTEAAALDSIVRHQVASPGWLEDGDPDAAAGEAAGRIVAEQVVESAKRDRYFAPWTGTVPVGPGSWFSSTVPPTPPSGATVGEARPFFLMSGSQFRPAAPPAFGSKEFVDALAEVRRISETRTPEQDSLAKFWAFPVGTYTGGGYWNEEASRLATRAGFGERRASHLLALMNMTSFDAIIASHDAKYHYWLIRPSQADSGITLSIGLPNFPSYPSNHATVSTATAEIIGAIFPDERDRLRGLAEQAALSRVYGGIHYRFDGEVGVALGRTIARHALEHDVGERKPFPVP